MEKIILEVDYKIGEVKCKYYVGRIFFLYEEEVRIIVCNSFIVFCKILFIFLNKDIVLLNLCYIMVILIKKICRNVKFWKI